MRGWEGEREGDREGEGGREPTLTSVNAIPIIRVHHEYESLCVLVVVSPQRSDFILKKIG